MSSLEKRYDGRYRIVFCWQGERRHHSLGKTPEREARSCLDRLEESLRLVDRELMGRYQAEPPEGVKEFITRSNEPLNPGLSMERGVR